MQSQHLLFKPADHNQLQPIQLLSTSNNWYQGKSSPTMPRFKQTSCWWLCVCMSVRMCVTWPVGYSPVGSLSCLIGRLPVSSHCTRDRNRPRGLSPAGLSPSLSFAPLLSVCQAVRLRPALRPALADFGFCLAGRAVGKQFDWRENKAHPAIFEAAVPVQDSLRWNAHNKQIWANTLSDCLTHTLRQKTHSKRHLWHLQMQVQPLEEINFSFSRPQNNLLIDCLLTAFVAGPAVLMHFGVPICSVLLLLFKFSLLNKQLWFRKGAGIWLNVK